MLQNKKIYRITRICKNSRLKQMWNWWRAKLILASKTPWYANYLLRRFYDLMKVLRPSKQLIASTITGGALLVGSVANNPASVQASVTITVNSIADTAIDGDGACTLREALNNAIDAGGVDTTGGDCVAGTDNGSDIIDLTSVNGTITLTSDLPNIKNSNEHIVLNGPGAANLTIDGVSKYRTIYSKDTSFGVINRINIKGLTIIKSSSHGIDVYRGDITVVNSTISGNSGAGISSNSYNDITITNSIISDNDGAGIAYSDGNTNVIISTISGNKGSGISVGDGQASVTNSTVSGNGKSGIFVRYGNANVINSVVSSNGESGIFAYRENANVTNSIISSNGESGIFVSGNASVVNSTVSDNQGSGVSGLNGQANVINSTISGNGQSGIVISDGDGNVSVINSTISGNSESGILVGYGNASVVNSTIYGSGSGGILALDKGNQGAVIVLKNSLIVGNNDGNGDVSCELNSAFATSNGHNIISDDTNCATLAREVTTATLISILDTSLVNNGGDIQTHALVMDSPAIDAGNNADLVGSTDQRGTGYSRIFNGTVDIGAYEVQMSLIATPTNTPILPTETPLPTNTLIPPTSTPFPTNTPILPTETPLPTNTPIPTDTPAPQINRFQGCYFDNPNLVGDPVICEMENITGYRQKRYGLYHSWGSDAPQENLPVDGWSVRYIGMFEFSETAIYRFHCQHNDGCRVFVDEVNWIDAWWGNEEANGESHEQSDSLNAGVHTITVEFFDQRGSALLDVWWERVVYRVYLPMVRK